MRSPLKGIAAVGVTMAIMLGTVGLLLRARPVGLFESQPIVGYHDAGDVLRFRNGQVTFATCCGTSPMGVYFRSNCIWVWRVRGIEWEVTPRATRIICREVADPTNVFVLHRRLIAPSEKGHPESNE